ncbi:Teichoic acid translocation permease protein TagG [Paraliobacillus sp. PM-2]|uniref:ABC transporter permease n=1 Tax=Paraliobacillus sp. PM-2 TaxID=1462524 RepID=UPI00061CCEF2|nr:ABC transporter permease [Paraliobacillus sp. PM-2]CQR46201.1 Teichoic acid translocation permease protein TagG [Paraliobacillus sp. PM-2]
MKSAWKVFKEQFQHFYLVRRLSLYELKNNNSNNYLGIAWEVINPLFQIGIYWFVFGYGIRQRSEMPVAENMTVPFINWMLAGMIIWLFFYQSIIQGSKSIYTRIKMLSKMNFPMSIIPNFVVFSRYYIHLVMLVITIIIMQMTGFTINLYYVQFIYFTIALFAFTFSLSLLMSTLSTIIRDIQMFLQATLRMVLYLSPILWNLDALPEKIQFIMKLNPLYYLIEGYRSSFFGLDWYMITNWQYTLYFWGITLVIFILASILHVKFRRHFIDFA